MDELGTAYLGGLEDFVDLARGKIVHDHDVARAQGRPQHLFHVGRGECPVARVVGSLGVSSPGPP